MKNHLNILPKLASFDLKCSKMRWGLGLRPRPRWGSLRRSPRPPNRKRQRAFGARHSLFRVHFYISIPLSGPPYGIPGSATEEPDPQGPGQGQGPDPKDQDKDKDLLDLTPNDKDKDLTPKDQDKDLKYVLKKSFRTRTRTRITSRQIILIAHINLSNVLSESYS